MCMTIRITVGLVTAFTMAPTLRDFDNDMEVNIETDDSNYVSAAVLTTGDDEGVSHRVA